MSERKVGDLMIRGCKRSRRENVRVREKWRCDSNRGAGVH